MIKQYSFVLMAVFVAMFAIPALRAQSNCYVRLTDASGYTPAAEQIAALEQAAAALCLAFDSSGFGGQFKVYDFGFYLHHETTAGGYPEPFARKVEAVAALSPYYLLFGKQSDRSGVYTRFWVALKMPTSAQFSCMTALQREVYSKRVQKKTADKYNEDNKTTLAYHEAEIAGITELQKIIDEIKECCIVVDRNGVAQRLAGCDGCSDEVANSYFDLADFRTIEFPITVSDFATINASKIKDVSNCKFSKNNQLAYLGSHFGDFVADINNRVSFNLIVTSNQSLCTNPIQDLEDFSRQQEFNCWIDFGTQNSNIASSYIKIVWNQDKAQCIKDPQLAQLVVKDLYCYVYSELEILDNECVVVIPPSPPSFCPYNIPITNDQPSGGLTISQFIQLVRQEESKYTVAEQEDTKTMITRFRKLFYGSPAWDDQLIPGSASIPCIKPFKIQKSENSRKVVHTTPSFTMVDMGYFPINPSNKQRPAINAVTNPGTSAPQTQEVRLEVGNHANYLIDIGHTLCGMDAYFNQQAFTYKLIGIPVSTLKVDRNLDAVTWLGDLASAQAEMCVEWVNKGRDLYPNESQALIDHYSSAPDMLGDIDGIVIGVHYCNNNNSNIKKVSDILEHYYLGAGSSTIQNKRYTFFSQNLGLVWDSAGSKFSNFDEKVAYFNDQVNDAAGYYVAGAAKDAGFTSLPGGCYFMAKLSMNPVSKKLLRCFFKALEAAVLFEQ